MSTFFILTSVSSLRIELALGVARDDVTRRRYLEASVVVNAVLALAVVLVSSVVMAAGLGGVSLFLAAAVLVVAGSFEPSSMYCLVAGRLSAQAVARVAMAAGQLAIHLLPAPDGHFGAGQAIIGFSVPRVVAAAWLLHSIGCWRLAELRTASSSTIAAVGGQLRSARDFVVWATASSGFGQLYGQMLVVLSAATVGSGAAGAMMVANRMVSSPGQVINRTLSQSFLGYYAEAHARKELRAAVGWTGLKLLVVAVLIWVLGASIGGRLASLLVGDGWPMVGTYVAWLTVPFGAQIVAVPLAQSMSVVGRQRDVSMWHASRIATLLAVFAVLREATGGVDVDDLVVAYAVHGTVAYGALAALTWVRAGSDALHGVR
jgi:hypothetical protein